MRGYRQCTALINGVKFKDGIAVQAKTLKPVLGVKTGFNFSEWNNRINRLSYDFVVCAQDSTVLAVIELDDKSHESTSSAERDKKKERATAAAGVRLIRWHVKSLPDHAAIQAAFSAAQPNPSLKQTTPIRPK